MKTTILITIVYFFQIFAFGQTQSDFTGWWQGNDQTDERVSFEFNADSTVIFSGGGGEFIFDHYRIIPDTNPIQLVINATVNDKLVELYCLVEFLSEHEIKVEMFPDFNGMNYPTQFSESKQNQIILDRVVSAE